MTAQLDVIYSEEAEAHHYYGCGGDGGYKVLDQLVKVEIRRWSSAETYGPTYDDVVMEERVIVDGETILASVKVLPLPAEGYFERNALLRQGIKEFDKLAATHPVIGLRPA